MPKYSKLDKINPISLIAITAILSSVALIWLSWYSYTSNIEFKATKEQNLKIEELHGTIRYLDEALTMSALMAASTGDLKWKDRYQDLQPLLQNTLTTSNNIVSKLTTNTTPSEIEAVYFKLNTMNEAAFKFVKKGQKNKALALLTSDPYKEQKRIYTHVLTKLTNTKQNYIRLAELRNTIIYLDEILTMSARMVVNTGDLQWEQRYLQHVGPLNEAIKVAIEFSPETFAKDAAQKTDKANKKLVEFENAAFNLVRIGRIEEARAILFSDEYTQVKNIYANGMTEFSAVLSNDINLGLKTEQDKAFIKVAVVLISVSILIVSWIGVFYSVLGWKKTLTNNHSRLSVQAAVLAELNHKLDSKVDQRTVELVHANKDLHQEIEMHKNTEQALQYEKEEQKELIQQLSSAHEHLLQSEKMASIGQLAAGVAHEINNPVGFIKSNLNSLESHTNDLLTLLNIYEQHENTEMDSIILASIRELKERIELNYLKEDIKMLIAESKEGILRVERIVHDLKDFSHVDEIEWHLADLHKGIESTLNIVNNQIKYIADVNKEFGKLPEINCMISQLNQVFMNLFINAAHAIGKGQRGTITIRTGVEDEGVFVDIIDTGKGMNIETQSKIFDPFYTTKPVGEGTGLGLSLSFGIVKKHNGKITVKSELGKGTQFHIWLPKDQN